METSEEVGKEICWKRRVDHGVDGKHARRELVEDCES